MSEERFVIPQFVIAAASSGAGKTTLSIGLMRLLSERGYKVAPFKCGPDYIDTRFHEMASGEISMNLDLFMSSEAHVKDIYISSVQKSDVAIVEGVMGMFDGYDKSFGSSAQVAKTLGLPVVLVVNGASAAFSVAPLIYGFQNFDQSINIKGVIFNNVSSESHFRRLKEACDEIGVNCFGYLGKNEALRMPSRHLGLNIDDRKLMEGYIRECANSVGEHVDINRLLEAMKMRVPKTISDEGKLVKEKKTLAIAVARDDAFSFIYDANLRVLRSHQRYDISIRFFSPLSDDRMPECDILYLPGGYPELYLESLSANVSMRRSIKKFCENDGKVLAECGGFMYLTERIDNHPMCGVFPIIATMTDSRLHLGYRTLVVGNIILRGHEFHYSRLEEPSVLKSIARISSAKGKEVATGLYRHKNVIAGYSHLYWAETDILKLWGL